MSAASYMTVVILAGARTLSEAVRNHSPCHEWKNLILPQLSSDVSYQINLWMVDPTVVLEKFVVNTGGLGFLPFRFGHALSQFNNQNNP
jgi:hypothetical protein